MLTLEALNLIHDALISAQLSNDRARNKARHPDFHVIYDKIDQDITKTIDIIKSLKTANPSNIKTK